MYEFFSIVIFLWLYYAALYCVLKLRAIPICGAVPIAFAVIISLQCILLNILSQFNLVKEQYLFFVYSGLLCLWLVFCVNQNNFKLLKEVPKRVYTRVKYFILMPASFFIVPYYILLFLIMVTNAPSTWDSLTYHMARVVHWLNNSSVAYYFTSIDRQNEMTPGAEYLILFFQILTKDDILAGFPQFFSFLLVPFSLYYLLRVFKVHREFIPFLILIALSTPMGVLQATTTQNDLVASIMVMAIIIAFIKLSFSPLNYIKHGEFALMGACLGAGYMVKPTSWLVVFPFLLYSGMRQVSFFRYYLNDVRNYFGRLVVFLLAFLPIVGFDLFRKFTYEVSRFEVFPMFSGWDAQRFMNPLKSITQNIPWPHSYVKFLQEIGFTGDFYPYQVFNNNNDFVGNPVQMLLLLGCSFTTICLGLLSLRHDKSRCYLFYVSLCPVLSLLIFGLFIRDQPWVTRLQLPIFLLSPIVLVYIINVSIKRNIYFFSVKTLIICITLFSITYGGYAGSRNPERPLALTAFWGQQERQFRYKGDNRPDELFAEASKLDCRRIGMLLGGDVADYPFTWQAYQRGMVTRHLPQERPGEWPCIMLTHLDGGNRLNASEYNWIARNNFMWVRDLAFDFKASNQILLDISTSNSFEMLKPVLGHNQSLTVLEDGFLIQAFDHDPAIILPHIEFADLKTIIL
jgi:hypothetical protein